MNTQVELKRYGIQQANYYFLKVWRLRVEATSVEGSDPKIFLWSRNLPDPDTGDTVDTFETIATVADMSVYPPDNPAEGQADSFYRSDFFEIDLRSQLEFDQSWETTKQYVRQLLEAIDRATRLVELESITLSGAPDVGR